MNKINKLTSIILAFAMLCSIAVIGVSAEEMTAFDDSEVVTDTLLLVDADSNEVLYSKNEDVQRPIASVTKIMTCILALENIYSPQDYMIEIKNEPVVDILNQDASCAGFQDYIGESFSALDIIYGMMLPSGCEAAQILAYEVGSTPENFAEMMNEKAFELGCENTYFEEAHGLSDENYSTAEDLAVIAKYAMENPLFREIVSTEYYQPEGFSAPFFNTNKLIAEENNTGLYNQYVTGIKTGSTTLAGRCLVSSAQKGEDEFICVALGAEYSDKNYAIEDTAKIYDWALDTFTENVYVDIKRDYASVEEGANITLSASVETTAPDQSSDITWSSSNESVAQVDDNGKVYGVKAGQAKITAETSTGNVDTIRVSVGFYNGITVTSRDGDYTSGAKENINWNEVKNSGFDFAVIRAGWGSEDYPNQNDAQFASNVTGASQNELPFYLSFVAYAQSETEAVAEADYFLREMEEYFPTQAENYLVSVIYNMSDSSFNYNSKEINTKIAIAFADKLKEYGYDTAICANKSIFANMDLDELESHTDFYYMYYPYVTDFSNPAQLNGATPDMWEYRSDGYFLPASKNGNTTLCVSYNKPLPKTDDAENILGDVNGDGNVSVEDATLIQKYSASLIDFTADEKIRADVNADGDINVSDATLIQKYIANLNLDYPIGEKIKNKILVLMHRSVKNGQ